MTLNSSIDYFLGPVAFLGVALRHCMYDNYGVGLMVSSTDSSEEYYSIPGSFGSPTANILTMTSWLPYLRVSKTKTVAVLRINDGVYQSEMCQGIVDESSNNEIDTVFYQDMPFDWWTLGSIVDNKRDDEDFEFARSMRSRFGINDQSYAYKRDEQDTASSRSEIWIEALDRIIEKNPDAVAICDYGYGSKFALEYFKAKNWIPKSIEITPLYLKYEDPSLLNFVVMPTQFSPSAKYVPQVNFTNSAGYANLVSSKYNGRAASSVTSQATLSLIIYANALIRSSTNQTEHLVSAMRSNQLRTFTGLVVMDGYDRNTLPSLVTQIMESGKSSRIVGPANAAVDSFIYPMPTWNERVFNNKWGSKGEIASVVLISVGLLICFGCSILVIFWRNNPFIYGASPVFCGLIIFGSALVILSMVTWMPSLVSTTVCMLRPWFLPLGFIILFGALLAKTYRVDQLFNEKSMEVIAISNWPVAAIVGSFVLVQIVFSSLMIAIGPGIPSRLVVVDAFRPSTNYYACTFNTHAKVIFGFNAA